MNRNGNPRLLKYWRDRYRRRREEFNRLGLTSQGTPRKRRRTFTDPDTRRVIYNEGQLRRFHRRVDNNRAAGLTARGTPRKRAYPRHRHENFVSPIDPPSVQKEQQHAQNQYRNARALEAYHRRAEQNKTNGLTATGKPRKYKRLSPVELDWQKLRATMNIQVPENLAFATQEGRAERLTA